MSELRADEVTVTLPRAELQEVVNALTRSITWSQQIISSIVLQAQAQAQPTAQASAKNGGGGDDDYAPPPVPPPPAPAPSSPGRRKPGTA